MAAETTFTIYDLHDTDVPRSPRELPRLVLAALRIVWSAGRRQSAIAIALQVVGGLGTAALVLLGKQVLDGLLAADRTGGGIEDFLPSAAALAVVTAVLGLLGAVRREQEELLAELTTRYAQARILDVACAVELAAFDEPGFHDRVARAQASVQRAPRTAAVTGAVYAGSRRNKANVVVREAWRQRERQHVQVEQAGIGARPTAAAVLRTQNAV